MAAAMANVGRMWVVAALELIRTNQNIKRYCHRNEFFCLGLHASLQLFAASDFNCPLYSTLTLLWFCSCVMMEVGGFIEYKLYLFSHGVSSKCALH